MELNDIYLIDIIVIASAFALLISLLSIFVKKKYLFGEFYTFGVNTLLAILCFGHIFAYFVDVNPERYEQVDELYKNGYYKTQIAIKEALKDDKITVREYFVFYAIQQKVLKQYEKEREKEYFLKLKENLKEKTKEDYE